MITFSEFKNGQTDLEESISGDFSDHEREIMKAVNSLSSMLSREKSQSENFKKFRKIKSQLAKDLDDLSKLVEKDSMNESKQSEEFVLQSLADADINSYIEDDIIFVDKGDMITAQKIIKKIGDKRKLKTI